jgi:hypothetical protein
MTAPAFGRGCQQYATTYPAGLLVLVSKAIDEGHSFPRAETMTLLRNIEHNALGRKYCRGFVGAPDPQDKSR